MAKDALVAHARDELGISEAMSAKPIPGGVDFGGDFFRWRVPPLAVALASPPDTAVHVVFAASLAFLAVWGAIGAWGGGANIMKATVRVAFWGALAVPLASVRSSEGPYDDAARLRGQSSVQRLVHGSMFNWRADFQPIDMTIPGDRALK